jgi:hypothetical protein
MENRRGAGRHSRGGEQKFTMAVAAYQQEHQKQGLDARC